jgi:FkbH-like protein
MSIPIKCLVWDLDNTLWKGSVLENGSCHLRKGIKGILRELDKRGILLSIASTNDEKSVLSFLKSKKLHELFLHPQINWLNKVGSLRTIAKQLNTSFDSIGFIDDEPYELEQARTLLPSIRTYHARDYRKLLTLREFNPEFITREGRRRRLLYVRESQQALAKQKSRKSQREFLKWCKTTITFRDAKNQDLMRILELLQRTHQLNSTGKVFSTESIRSFLHNSHYRVYVAQLKDRFADYGIIGVAICRCYSDKWRLICFLLSCRILGRGIGGVFLSWLQYKAFKHGVSYLEGLYIKQKLNHPMSLLLQLAGFRPQHNGKTSTSIFVRKCELRIKSPEWLTIHEREVV